MAFGVQLDAAVNDYDFSTLSPSLVAVAAAMNALESLGMTSEIEQRQTLSNLCTAVDITDCGMAYLNKVRTQLYHILSETDSTPTQSASFASVEADSYDSDVASEDVIVQNSTLARPTSPNSVSAPPGSQFGKKHSHSHRLRPQPNTQNTIP
ncbi:MAG: hypothetical protein SGARI_004342 [Bacillariaceae sp.]